MIMSDNLVVHHGSNILISHIPHMIMLLVNNITLDAVCYVLVAYTHIDTHTHTHTHTHKQVAGRCPKSVSLRRRIRLGSDPSVLLRVRVCLSFFNASLQSPASGHLLSLLQFR